MTIPEGYMQDAMGRLVPEDMVKPVDKMRDGLVKELVARVKDLQRAMIAFKSSAMGDVNAFCDLSAEKYDVKLGGKKGNISLVSFDGRYKIQLSVADLLNYDERMQAAKALIDECVVDWAADSREEIKVLINDAFQVNKEGKINIGRVLTLRRLNIDDDRWRRAMQAISDSLHVTDSKLYFRAYERNGQDDKWVAIALDIAAL